MQCAASSTRLGEMRALRGAALRAASTLPLRPRRALQQQQRAGHRGTATPVRAILENVITAEDEKLAQQKAQLDASLAKQAGTPAAGAAPGGEPATAGTAVKPGDDDSTRFQLHWSVPMWKEFAPKKWLDAVQDETAPVPDRIRAFTDTLTNALGSTGALGSSQAAAYWAYHIARSGFFMAQGIASLAATRRAVTMRDSPAVSRFEEMVRSGWAGPVGEAMLSFYQDYENIKEGKYALPWDMTTTNHRQFNPLFVLQRASAFLTEATDTLRRRDAGAADPIWLKAPLLPDYFTSGFHYQTDGWLSQQSAKVYESSTETLFVGRQDAMQRCTLVPLADFMAGKDVSQLQALEVAAGTGRFATFVKDNYPGLQLTVSDLSPFYLAEARSNIQYWKKMRAPDADFGGIAGTGVTFLQTAAEKLDVPDNSQDIVYCVYLFHELPEDVRRQAAAEMARVVKPGGIVILTDSAQLGDRDVYDATLGNFGAFNEPYYRNYVETPLGPLFEAAGLKCGMKVSSSTTKSLSFYKPIEDDKFAVGGSAEEAAAAAAAAVAIEALEDE